MTPPLDTAPTHPDNDATELDSIDTFVNVHIDLVVDFLMDMWNVRDFAFGKEEDVHFDFQGKSKMRVYNPLLKSVTQCENRLIRREDLALVEHRSFLVQQEIGWEVFLLVKAWGEQRSHILFGWYNTPGIKKFMCEMHGWESFDPLFVREQVARKELSIIKALLEAKPYPQQA